LSIEGNERQELLVIIPDHDLMLTDLCLYAVHHYQIMTGPNLVKHFVNMSDPI